MCGIAGTINRIIDYPRLKKDLLHRGPDNQTRYDWKNISLFHFRLSIQDIASGAQPMHLNEKYTIVFNGEIYNHQELRKQYSLNCHTQSDTETLIQLFALRGIECLHDLDGMFAIALIDKETHTLTLIRDRAGKKPLYYFYDGESFFFCSELKALSRQLSLQHDSNAISEYIYTGTFLGDHTPYAQVNELINGTYLQINLNTLSISTHAWWNMTEAYLHNSTDHFDEALYKVDSLLHTAIRRRLESSDLEVASFLSGGIDSGLVVAIASDYKPNMKTFTVSFNGQFDEAPYAKQVAEKYHTDHHELLIGFDSLSNDIESILGNYGEPFCDSSAIPSYYVSKAARKHVTVILNGDGADELFGGYRRYVPFSKFNFLKSHKALQYGFSLLHRLLPPGKEKMSSYQYLYRLIDLAGKNATSSYLSATTDLWPEPDFNAMHSLTATIQAVNQLNLSGLKSMMLLDYQCQLFTTLLVKMDIATMANSLEGRSPFLCKELQEYAPSLPDTYKIRGTQTKVLLRQLAKKYLPTDLIQLPKRGFEVPLASWVDGVLQPVIYDYLRSPNALFRNYIHSHDVDDLLEGKSNAIGAVNRSKILWNLFCLEVWNRQG